jgi:hypothetical protein
VLVRAVGRKVMMTEAYTELKTILLPLTDEMI